jgi:hypothetical protein
MKRIKKMYQQQERKKAPKKEAVITNSESLPE